MTEGGTDQLAEDLQVPAMPDPQAEFRGPEFPDEADGDFSEGAEFDEDAESKDPNDLRAGIMAQFEAWLDGMLAGESAPPVPEEIIAEAIAGASGDNPESASADLFTLFGALTALSGEIRLQGRSFKQLTDALAPVSRVPAAIEDLQEAQHLSTRQIDRLAEQLRPADAGESALPAPKEILGVLFDLLERLERGLTTFETGIDSIKAIKPAGFLARLAGAQRQSAQTLETLEAMHEGYRLTLSRLQSAVEQWGIQRIGRAGEPFDPGKMVAIDVDSESHQPDGTIVSVYRSGYMHQGHILATAQVKVAKAK